MRYDLRLIHARCQELGLPSAIRVNERVEITLGKNVILCFANAESEDDCLVGFEGTPWHAHDYFMFADALGNYVELEYIDLVAGLAKGQLLICESYRHGVLTDRWLIHRDYNNEFKYLEEGEEIKVFRPITSIQHASK